MKPRTLIRQIFLDVVQRPEAERPRRLTELCGDDSELRADVEALLRADDDSFLDRPAIDVAGLAHHEPIVELKRTDEPDEWREFLDRLTRRRGEAPGVTVINHVGSGGMGTVMRVFDEHLRRHLAMKVVSTRDAPDAQSLTRRLSRFLEEAQVTAQLDHPGIVPVHDIGADDDGRVFFTMKLVRGRDLREIFDLCRVGTEGWNRARVLSLLLRACEAVAFAHRKGVIHRDLKPGNIMVGRYGEVYVMDWGLARVLGEPDQKDIRLRPNQPVGAKEPRHGSPTPSVASAVVTDRQSRSDDSDGTLETLDGDVVGTPAYMAPEQAAGRVDEIGPHSDVYSMGAILYHLLSGQAPYLPPGTRASQYTVLRFVLEGPPIPIDQLARDEPPELVAICLKAMARDSSERYRTMEELAEDLRAFLEGRVVKAYAAGAAAELRKWVERNRAVATTVLACLVAIVAVTTFFVVRLRSSERHATAKSIEAEDNRRIAEESQRRTQAVLDRFLLAQLRERIDTLWPIRPESSGAMRAWLDEAYELIGRAPSHAALREALLSSSRATADELGGLEQLLGDLDSFAEGSAAAPTVAKVEERLERANTLASRTLDDHAVDWSEAAQAIAAAPHYDGLRIRPQLGLVPLGPDPRSGLWEFAHVLSGDAPQRVDGDLVLSDATALVLVLLPAGEFTMGAQREDETAPNYDPDAAADESPPHAVRVDPFFISKYEMTQGQWLAVAAHNPSYYRGELRPAEHISWEQANLWLARVDLVLPTEAQWEYATRGGTSTPWFSGANLTGLDRYANLADASAPQLPGWSYNLELDDGFASTAPVGSLGPNPFGLHDCIGNLYEWCRDEYFADAYKAPGAHDPRPSGSRSKVYRGGSFGETATTARASGRGFAVSNAQSVFVGVRPARPLDR